MPILGYFCLELMLNQINYQYHWHNREHPDKTEWQNGHVVDYENEHNSLPFSVSISFQKDFQFTSVPKSCPTFCDPMNCSMPGLPIHHQLPEITQTHVHWVDKYWIFSIVYFILAVNSPFFLSNITIKQN